MQQLRMKPATFREIAKNLGVSPSTVSRAFHQDPRISADTARRVMEMVKKEGYQLDPVVSAGMSKIRQRDFYRETLAWCGDHPRKETPWYEPMFQAAEDYGSRLGYRIEHCHVRDTRPAALSRLVSVWKARGIRGVVLGPFQSTQANLALPWEAFAWVVVGRPFSRPALHTVGRDHAADLQTALTWLGGKGCRRVCFLFDPEKDYPFIHPLQVASLLHYHGVRAKPRTPCFHAQPEEPEAFRSWVDQNRPDGLILPHPPEPRLAAMLRPLLDTLPSVFLTSMSETVSPPHACFRTRFDVMGRVSVNLLHRLLLNREIGVPSYQQTIVLNSQFLAETTGA